MEYGLFTYIIAQGILLLAIGDIGIRNINIWCMVRNKSRTNDIAFNGAVLRIAAVVTLIPNELGLLYRILIGGLLVGTFSHFLKRSHNSAISL